MTRAHVSFPFAFTLLVVLALPNAAGAMTYIVVPDPALADQADLIAWARITEIESKLTRGSIWTEYRASLQDVVKGHHPEATVRIRVPGGTARSGKRTLQIWGAPTFRKDEEALVFLGRNSGGSFRILHVAQGVFRTSSGSTLFRELAEHGRLGLGTMPLAVTGPRNRGRFVGWLRDRANGILREPDYFVADRAGSRGARAGSARTPRATFRLLGREVNFRWPEFDRREEIRWFRHQQPQPGLKNTGRVLKRSIQAWNEKHTGAPVRYRFAGTTDSTTGFTRSDGRNTVMFQDFNESIGDDFSCEAGGVLALGGVSSTASRAATWKGLSFQINTEAEVVVNDGVECLLEIYPSLATQIYVHELGHTLGLGHSCVPFAETCTRHSADATMAAIIQAPGRGARLSADDLTGIGYLYDPDSQAVFCTLPPGHKNFCAKCGPCGERQGSCSNDGQCAEGLVCAKGAGFELGFRPRSSNICLAAEE